MLAIRMAMAADAFPAMCSKELSWIDALELFGVFIQILNYQSDLSQESNADLARHLQAQEQRYLERILENQNKILSILEKSNTTK